MEALLERNPVRAYWSGDCVMLSNKSQRIIMGIDFGRCDDVAVQTTWDLSKEVPEVVSCIRLPRRFPKVFDREKYVDTMIEELKQYSHGKEEKKEETDIY